MDKHQVKQDAKRILDKFAKALEKVKDEKISINIEREEFERKERDGEGVKNKEFKEDFLKNAPNKDKDFVLVEKGGWK